MKQLSLPLEQNLVKDSCARFAGAVHTIQTHKVSIEKTKRVIADTGGDVRNWAARLSEAEKLDPLHQHLREKYLLEADDAQSAKHDLLFPFIADSVDKIELAQNDLLEALLDVCRGCDVRFASVWRGDLITFEDIRRDHWPVAWYICGDLLRIMSCGNSSQAQFAWPRTIAGFGYYDFLPERLWGTYDLRIKPYIKVAPFASLKSMKDSIVEKKIFGNINLLDWFTKCGCNGIDPYSRKIG